MRTRELKVWVSPSDLGNKYFYVAHENADCPMKGDSVKARLIIELPEKKIEISESEFDEALSGLAWESSSAHEAIRFLNVVKQKLFGKEEK